MSNILSCNDLSLKYGKTSIINNLNVNFQDTGLYTLLGANGSGKSTFLKALLQDPFITIDGNILINSDYISHRNIAQNIAFMPQFLQVPFAFTVLEVVMMGHKKYTYFLSDKREIIQKARECLEELDILHLEHSNIQTLSGGQRALVFIAKTLCKNSPIILLDEPDSALDFTNRLLLFSYLEKLKKKKLIIISSHDPTTVLRYSDFIIPIYKDSPYTPIALSDINKEVLLNIYPHLHEIPFSLQDHNSYKQLIF